MRFARILIYLAAVLGCASQREAVAAKIYWVDAANVKIQRANLDGSGIEDVITSAQGLVDPFGVAVDSVAGKIYFTDLAAGGNGGRIMRANMDGSNVEFLVDHEHLPPGDSTLPFHIALDPGAGKMYWADHINSRIRRANLDGTNIEDLITFGAGSAVRGIALDLVDGKMYFTDLAEIIRRANLDGSNIETLVVTNATNPSYLNPTGIALDLAESKMYWTLDGVFNASFIQRANLDGSCVETLSTTENRPLGITVDSFGGKLYWTTFSLVIRKSDLDWSNKQDFITGLGRLLDGITVDLSSPPPPVGLPDLTINSASWTDFPQCANRTNKCSRLEATIANIGNALASSVVVRFAASEDGGATFKNIRGPVHIKTLPAGGVSVAAQGWGPKSGTYQIRVVVDPDNRIVEMDESNNAFVFGVTVP